jgi:hypothetical protein
LGHLCTRISTQVIVAVGAVTALTIGATSVLVIRAHERALVAELRRSTIRSSTHFDMLENRRESVHRQIATIGRQPGMEKVQRDAVVAHAAPRRASHTSAR